MLFTAVAASTTLSSDFGADAWPIVASKAVLIDAPNNPSSGVIGVVPLAMNRLPAAMRGAPSQTIPSLHSAQQVSIMPAHQPAQFDHEESAVLIKQGRLFLANRDPAGARVVLERAAAYKDAEAALLLAGTYDPVVLRELKIYGLAANIAKARTWYEMAKEFGSTEAPRRLEILASATD
jgi:hypothetical protein